VKTFKYGTQLDFRNETQIDVQYTVTQATPSTSKCLQTGSAE